MSLSINDLKSYIGLSNEINNDRSNFKSRVRSNPLFFSLDNLNMDYLIAILVRNRWNMISQSRPLETELSSSISELIPISETPILTSLKKDISRPQGRRKQSPKSSRPPPPTKNPNIQPLKYKPPLGPVDPLLAELQQKLKKR